VSSRVTIRSPSAAVKRTGSMPSLFEIVGVSGRAIISEQMTMKSVSSTRARPADWIDTPAWRESPTLPTAAQTLPGMYLPRSDMNWIE